MKFYYAWRELQLVSIQTLSTVITFIQFAIIPLDTVTTEAQKDKSPVEEFISINFGPAAKVFLAPFDFIRQFKKVAAPLRVALFATIILALINFLYVIFFYPAWRLILFLLDLFIPGMCLFGILFLARDYEAQKGVGIALTIVGIIYFVGRILYYIWPLFNRTNKKWYKKCVHTITAVFLSRITEDKDESYLQEKMKKVREKIKEKELNVPLDKERFTMLLKIVDASVAGAIWLTVVVILGIGWKKIISKSYDGAQLDHIVDICNIISYALIAGFSLRLLINAAWFLPDMTFNIFKLLRRLAFKSICFISGIILLPVLKMVLQSTATTTVQCDFYQFYDFRSNTESFLQYFMVRDGMGCVNCSKKSANFIAPCTSICYYSSEFPLQYRVLADSNQVTESDLSSIYLIPIVMLEIYFLVIFLQILRQIFSTSLEIVGSLPGPTKNIECKFATIVNRIQTAGVYIFTSYKYEQSLYYFTFTQIKLFVLFAASLFPVIPIKEVMEVAPKIIPWLFFIASLAISASQIFTSPYISILHNSINGLSYFIGGIAALLSALQVCELVQLSKTAGDVLFVLIIVVPIATALITPIFARMDIALRPCSYSLPRIMKWDKKLLQLQRKKLRGKSKSNNNDDSDDESISMNDFNEPDNKKDDERPHDLQVGSFSLLKLAPIHIQKGIKKKIKGFQQKSIDTWKVVDVVENKIDDAADDMLSAAGELIDCTSNNALSSMLSFSVIFCSACLGWCLGSGVASWKKVTGANDSHYLRCNMFDNETYPAFGTY